MHHFELSNHQRKYLGLKLTSDQWQKFTLNEVVSVYLNGDKIVKIINHDSRWYMEYDADIDTLDRKIILPLSGKGKAKKLTASNLLKIKGTGVQFTGSWQGGGISIYHLDTKVWLKRSHGEDDKIKSITDVAAWINAFIQNASGDYLEWLRVKLSQGRVQVKAKEGDVVAFAVSPTEFGFAHVLFNTSTALKTGSNPHHFTCMGNKRLLILAYGFISTLTAVDLTEVLQHPKLPAIYVFDDDVVYGSFPVVGNYQLTAEEIHLGYKADESVCYLTIPYSKRDLEAALHNSQQVT